MFFTYHMASMASSNLIAGYHQDVNLAAHVMTLPGTYVDEETWDLTAKVVYEERWKEKYSSYEDWKASFVARCISQKVEPISGSSLWSTLLPEDMEWKTKKAEIRQGILVRGTLDKGVLSGSPASIGMIMYRTYGSTECVSWLNASYKALNQYIIKMGVTLGISHLQISKKSQQIIDNEIQKSVSNPKLLEDTSLIKDPVLRERREMEITQDLNNVRERIAKIIMEGLQNTQKISIKKGSKVFLYQRRNKYSFAYGTSEFEDEIEGIPISGRKRIDTPVETEMTLDMYQGIIKIGKDEYPMAVFPVVTVDEKEYVYEDPNPLLMMIKSGARGNETNGIQISGIIGQQNYANGRIPRMMALNRSMPCFPPGDNTPTSRGFIVPSYLRGMSPADYVSAHVASRENLTSNTDLTPKTGYFARRLRVFLEDLRITRTAGRQTIENEKGVVVMFDFLLNPSYVFDIGGQRSFVDIKYEIDHMSRENTQESVYLFIPFLSNMKKYLSLDKRISEIVGANKDKDIILALDPKVEEQYPDFYDYLQQEYSNCIILTVPDLPENQKKYWYLSFDNYSRVVSIPLDKTQNITVDNIPTDRNYIQVNKGGINDITYPVSSGRINNSILYQMLISGSNFEKYPMSLKPSKNLFDMLQTRTLLESLIIEGPVFAM